MMSSNNEKIFTERPRTRSRLFLFGLLVFTGFSLIGAKIALLASKENQKSNSYFQEEKIHSRLNITDRNGYILATNLEGVSIYIRPQEIQKKSLVAKKLKNIFPDLDEVELLNK